ncbi:MAG: DUF2842 domain-containing protein [Alphaproteobacteria bacterium]|nr:MAG: DUF2842 domain-containing protein [Alphaproteobacteria bacterium]
MSVSTKKLIGTIVLLVGLVIYAFLCMIIAVTIVPPIKWVELAYYAFVGVAWAFPCKYLIIWMLRPVGEDEDTQ